MKMQESNYSVSIRRSTVDMTLAMHALSPESQFKSGNHDRLDLLLAKTHADRDARRLCKRLRRHRVLEGRAVQLPLAPDEAELAF